MAQYWATIFDVVQASRPVSFAVVEDFAVCDSYCDYIHDIELHPLICQQRYYLHKMTLINLYNAEIFVCKPWRPKLYVMCHITNLGMPTFADYSLASFHSIEISNTINNILQLLNNVLGSIKRMKHFHHKQI